MNKCPIWSDIKEGVRWSSVDFRDLCYVGGGGETGCVFSNRMPDPDILGHLPDPDTERISPHRIRTTLRVMSSPHLPGAENGDQFLGRNVALRRALRRSKPLLHLIINL